MAHTPVTLDDIARLSSVSKATVSRILSAKSGVPIPFAADTQERVRAAAQRLGYRPSRIARGLITSRTGIIGLVIPSIQDSFFPSVTSVIEEYLASVGYSVLLANTRGSASTEKEKIDELLSWRVDGLIIAPAQESMDAGPYWDLWRQQVAFVLLDRTFPDTPFASVTTDDASGSSAALEYLIRSGKTRIACAGGPMILSTCRVRRTAYQETLIRHGILPRSEYIIETPSTLEGGRIAVERILSQDPRPDALFCFSDLLAAGAMQACLDHRLRVPQDLAIVGFADLAYSSLLRVPLTTVRQPCDLIGHTIARALLERLTECPGPPEQHVLPVELIVRESA